MKTLWVFGHSGCLPYELKEAAPGWTEVLAEKNKLNLVNFSELGADNFFIYSSFCNNKSFIKENDVVIIGWSHYSRKSFVLDRKNKNQINILDTSYLYTVNGTEFIRSKNVPNGDASKWLSMKPFSRGIEYYDIWFDDYYSAHEQKCNFQSYVDSVLYTCPGKYIPFFFSQESVHGVDISKNNHAGFMTEFIVDNQFQLSEKDMHLNEIGHQAWAKHLQTFVDECIIT